MIDKIKRNLLSIRGKNIRRKAVIIESDDWGSIRMPSKETYAYLKSLGYNVEKDAYMKYDSLATENDLAHLYDVLRSIKDHKGNHPVITANTIVANPDFEKIKAGNFEKYHYEKFTDTLSRYPGCQNSFRLWQEGIEEKLFYPQFHGREHLNVTEWMKALQSGDPLVRQAFDLGMISISSEPSALKFAYMEGMDYFSGAGFESRSAILNEGLDIFNDAFGYNPLSFIANCYVWDDYVEDVLHKRGVKFLQGVSVQKKPRLDNGKHTHSLQHNYFGKRNHNNQVYTVRNAFFEPSHFIGQDNISDVLNRIETAFFWGKPAVISSHRINFIGAIDEKNRITNLKIFKELLEKILKKWPDVEFMTIDELQNDF